MIVSRNTQKLPQDSTPTYIHTLQKKSSIVPSIVQSNSLKPMKASFFFPSWTLNNLIVITYVHRHIYSPDSDPTQFESSWVKLKYYNMNEVRLCSYDMWRSTWREVKRWWAALERSRLTLELKNHFLRLKSNERVNKVPRPHHMQGEIRELGLFRFKKWRKRHLNTRKMLSKWVSTDCSNRLWDLHPWIYSKLKWKHLRTSWSNHTYFEKKVGRRPLSAHIILWFYERHGKCILLLLLFGFVFVK